MPRCTVQIKIIGINSLSNKEVQDLDKNRKAKYYLSVQHFNENIAEEIKIIPFLMLGQTLASDKSENDRFDMKGIAEINPWNKSQKDAVLILSGKEKGVGKSVSVTINTQYGAILLGLTTDDVLDLRAVPKQVDLILKTPTVVVIPTNIKKMSDISLDIEAHSVKNERHIEANQIRLRTCGSVENNNKLSAKLKMDIEAEIFLNTSVLGGGGPLSLKIRNGVDNSGCLIGSTVCLEASDLKNSKEICAGVDSLNIKLIKCLENTGSLSGNAIVILADSLKNNHEINAGQGSLNITVNKDAVNNGNWLAASIKLEADNLKNKQGINSSVSDLTLRLRQKIENDGKFQAARNITCVGSTIIHNGVIFAGKDIVTNSQVLKALNKVLGEQWSANCDQFEYQKDIFHLSKSFDLLLADGMNFEQALTNLGGFSFTLGQTAKRGFNFLADIKAGYFKDEFELKSMAEINIVSPQFPIVFKEGRVLMAPSRISLHTGAMDFYDTQFITAKGKIKLQAEGRIVAGRAQENVAIQPAKAIGSSQKTAATTATAATLAIQQKEITEHRVVTRGSIELIARGTIVWNGSKIQADSGKIRSDSRLSLTEVDSTTALPTIVLLGEAEFNPSTLATLELGQIPSDIHLNIITPHRVAVPGKDQSIAGKSLSMDSMASFAVNVLNTSNANHHPSYYCASLKLEAYSFINRRSFKVSRFNISARTAVENYQDLVADDEASIVAETLINKSLLGGRCHVKLNLKRTLDNQGNLRGDGVTIRGGYLNNSNEINANAGLLDIMLSKAVENSGHLRGGKVAIEANSLRNIKEIGSLSSDLILKCQQQLANEGVLFAAKNVECGSPIILSGSIRAGKDIVTNSRQLKALGKIVGEQWLASCDQFEYLKDIFHLKNNVNLLLSEGMDFKQPITNLGGIILSLGPAAKRGFNFMADIKAGYCNNRMDSKSIAEIAIHSMKHPVQMSESRVLVAPKQIYLHAGSINIADAQFVTTNGMIKLHAEGSIKAGTSKKHVVTQGSIEIMAKEFILWNGSEFRASYKSLLQSNYRSLLRSSNELLGLLQSDDKLHEVSPILRLAGKTQLISSRLATIELGQLSSNVHLAILTPHSVAIPNNRQEATPMSSSAHSYDKPCFVFSILNSNTSSSSYPISIQNKVITETAQLVEGLAENRHRPESYYCTSLSLNAHSFSNRRSISVGAVKIVTAGLVEIYEDLYCEHETDITAQSLLNSSVLGGNCTLKIKFMTGYS